MKYFLALLVSVVTAFSATYNVPGDHANINDALAVAQPGDTVLVSGIHNYVIYTERAGTAGNRITLDGQGTATIMQMQFEHEYNTCTGFNIRGRNLAYQGSVWFRRGAHYCQLINCVIDNEITDDMTGVSWDVPTVKPFSTDAASNCEVRGCTIKNVGNTACLNIAGDDNIIEGNTVVDGAEIDFVRLFGRRNIIRGNIFRNNYPHPTFTNHPDFIQCFGNTAYGSRDHIIEGNIIDEIPTGQITQLEGNLCPDIGYWTFRNNIFMNISNGASCTIPGIKYYNNLFYRVNYGLGGHPLAFGTRYYAQNRVDPDLAVYATLGDIDPNEVIEGGQYQVVNYTAIESGSLINGRQYIVTGSSSGYVTYNGVNYLRWGVFTADANASFTKLGAMVVYENSLVQYNGVTYRYGQYFTGTSNPNYTVVQYTPAVRVELPNRANGAEVWGNVFVNCGGDARPEAGWYGISTELTGVSADYNYVCKPAWGIVLQDVAQRPVGSASGWGYWWETNGINGGDPSFVNFANLDFRLTAGSILVDQGTAISGLTTDRLGIARPQGLANDIGPFEYESGQSPGTAPTAPSALTAAALGTTAIRLTWTDNSADEEFFTLERSLTGSTWFQPETVLTNLESLDITGLQPATTYYFRIRAGNAYGNSTFTASANATTDQLQITSNVSIAWDASPTGEEVTSYRVYERRGIAPTYSYALIGETTHTYFSLSPVRGVNEWVVRAVNATGAGPYSDSEVYFVPGFKSRKPKGKLPVPLTLQ